MLHLPDMDKEKLACKGNRLRWHIFLYLLIFFLFLLRRFFTSIKALPCFSRTPLAFKIFYFPDHLFHISINSVPYCNWPKMLIKLNSVIFLIKILWRNVDNAEPPAQHSAYSAYCPVSLELVEFHHNLDDSRRFVHSLYTSECYLWDTSEEKDHALTPK